MVSADGILMQVIGIVHIKDQDFAITLLRSEKSAVS